MKYIAQVKRLWCKISPLFYYKELIYLFRDMDECGWMARLNLNIL